MEPIDDKNRLPRHIKAYYDPKSTIFWIPAEKGWTRVKSIADYLKVNCRVTREEVGIYTLRVQEQHSLVYAGALAGRKPGIIRTDEGLVLVTTSFKLIEPKEGEWSFIRRMVEERLGNKQAKHLYIYLKLGYEALRDGKLSPGLFLAIVGPPDMHKTCVQELIITPVFGGRVAEPWQFFTSATDFNGDFIGAEHLIITDVEVKGNDKNSQIGSKVKQYCGTSSHRIHPKGRDAFQTLVLWRISQSCNDSWPHILALPDLSDPTVADKVLLLYFGGEPFGDWMPSDRNRIRAKVERELPCFVNYLVEMNIPPAMWDARFGQEPYKNRTAWDKYFSVTHEADLMEIIDEVMFKDKMGFFSQPGHSSSLKTREDWQGYANELEELLSRSNRWEQCKKLGATGQMLGKMLHNIAENPSTRLRVRVTTRANRSFYQIHPPSKVGS